MEEIGELELRVALRCDSCGNRYEWRPRENGAQPDMACPGCGERTLERIPVLDQTIADWNWLAIAWVLLTVVLAAMGVFFLIGGG